MEEWEPYLLGNVGASAALLGLLLVAVSPALGRILPVPGLPTRTVEALALLGAVLVPSSLLLVPDQPDWLPGIWILLAGLALFEIALVSGRTARGGSARPSRADLVRMAAGQVTALTYVVAGATVAVGAEEGLYVFAGGVVLAYAAGVANMWTILVEASR